MNNLERRPSAKKWLVVIVALGLGGLVLSGCERLGSRTEEGAGQEAGATREGGPPPWRTEKVFIFYSTETGKWLVDPGHKVVSPGQRVTWRFLGCAETPTIDLSGAPLSPQNVRITNGVGTATVNGNATVGFYTYTVKCGTEEAEGGTLPGLIVDP